MVELESRLARLPVDLAPVEQVAACTARLVASRAARVLTTARLGELLQRLRSLEESPS